MKLPPKKRPGNPILASDWNTLVDALAARTPRPSAGMEIVFTSGGFIYRVRPSASAAPAPVSCPFGEIITWIEGEGENAETKTGIRGGVVYVGDKNFNIDATALNLEADGTWLVYFEIECESNRDDDGEIILPGIKTTAAETLPMQHLVRETGTNYPDNTPPAASNGIGTVIVPLGKLSITDGTPSFEPVSCGNILIGQCAGVLSHTRG